MKIARLIADYAGKQIALQKLAAIEKTIAALADTPHLGSVRDDIFPGLRAIPAARKAVSALPWMMKPGRFISSVSPMQGRIG